MAEALDGLRVLDLSTRFGFYCGRLFADLGAEVILVEKPGAGCDLRRLPPFIGAGSGPDDSIPFFTLCANKLGITLDLDQREGIDLFLRLAATADLIIEDATPGIMAARGLDYATLSRANPSLVVTSITPFGQTGPWAQAPADDLVLLALGGFLGMIGYPDRAPNRPYGNQAEAMGSMFGAVGSMMAVLQSEAEGTGQHVDIAIQECVVLAMETAAQVYDLEGRIRQRWAGAQRQAGTGLFPCADGFIYIFAGGMAATRFWPNFVTWMRDENMQGADALDDPRWSTNAYIDTAEAKQFFADLFTGFAAKYTKEQLYREGQRRRVPICPLSTPSDLIANPQLQSRNVFTSLRHAASGRDITIPGVPYKLSETPGQVRRPAPRLGEHNVEIYGALGMDAATLANFARKGVI